MMVRGRVKKVVEGVIKRFSATGMVDVESREYIQHYGFTSIPKEGAEIVYNVDGNVVIALASDDRRYRLSIQEGEVALYDDRGQAVHLTQDGIVIKSGVVTIDGYAVLKSHAQVKSGASGTFHAGGKVVTVRNGIIVGIE